MSIRATSPYTLYLDADGTPLTSGYVYFGVAGSNPETVPIATYWDESLTIPAAQPLRTTNGFIMRNGSPGTIYTAAAYSVTVKNKNGVLVFSALTNPGVPVSAAMAPVMSAASLAAGLTAFGFTAFVQTLINDADAATFLATLGLTITAYAKTLLDDADAATARATLAVPSNAEAVLVTGNQTVAGIKTFSTDPVATVPSVRDQGAGAGALKCKVIEIGDWNMDATIFVNIAHGLAGADIRSLSVVIRHDTFSAGSIATPVPFTSISSADGTGGTEVDLAVTFTTTHVLLVRRGGGSYDNTGFDSTSYNRGWITIWYVG